MQNYLKYLLESILLAAALAGIVWLIAWRTLDVRIFSVQSGSMSPAFSKGDLLIDIQPKRLKIGDIVSYRSSTTPGHIISHRVIGVKDKSIVTKGDNLTTVDPPVQIAAVQGRAIAMLPKAGYLFDQLHRPAGLVAIVYVPALIVTAAELWLLTGRYKYRAYRFTQTT